MKLKKIVSLALAGIMAVSMLAGCSNDGGNNDSNSTTTVTTTDSANVAAVLNDSRTGYAKNVAGVSYKESASLEEMLKSIVTDKYGKDSAALEALTNSNNFAAANYTALEGTVADKLSPKVVGGIDKWSDVSSNIAKAGTYKYARIYYVGGGYTAKEAANSATTNVNALETSSYMPVVSGDVEYSAEVAAVKMTSNAHTDQSVWFIAVVYTQVVA